MSWIACVHLYLPFPDKASGEVAKSKLETFIYEALELKEFLLIELQKDYSITIQEINNELYDFESKVEKIQNFCRKEFQKNLEGVWQNQDRDGDICNNEIIDGKIETEHGVWLLEYSVPVIRRLRAIAEIISETSESPIFFLVKCHLLMVVVFVY